MTAILPELEVWRWTCSTCGRWISRDTLTEQTRIDPGEYYGISTTILGICSRCGVVADPQLRPVVWQDGGQSS